MLKSIALFSLLLPACNKSGPTPTIEPDNAAVSATAPRAVGHWRGALAVGGTELAIVVHVEHKGEPPALSATLDSPDQGGFGIPVAAITAEGDRFVLDVSGIDGRYEGSFTSDDRIEGNWIQGGASLPLALSRTTDAGGPPRRPQEPKPPFPYRTEEVTIPSVTGVTLAGTLTLPEGPGPFPAVLLVTGSGPQDRDEALMGHKPFAVLADHLARKGIASLRADDRGTAKSTGDFSSATTPDFADDAIAAMTWLDARTETDQIGCLGHSEGGLVCPLAQERAKEGARADFLVLIAGPAVPGLEILVEQSALIQMASGVSAEGAEKDRRHSRELFTLLSESRDAADRDARLLAKMKENPAAAGVPDEQLRASLEQLTSPWFLWFLEYDPAVTLAKLDVPTLALFGERDLQVPAAQNSEPMRRALGDTGTVSVLAGLNHLMQPAETGSPKEYATIETTMDSTALDAIASFILNTAKK